MTEVLAVVALALACAGWVVVQRTSTRGGARPLAGSCSGSCHRHGHDERERKGVSSHGAIHLPR